MHVSCRSLAKCLIEEKDLLMLLERLLYMPHEFPLNIYISVIKVCLQTSTLSCPTHLITFLFDDKYIVELY